VAAVTEPMTADDGVEAPPRARCAGITADGPCEAPSALLSLDARGTHWWCYAHHPGFEEARRVSSMKGGLATKLKTMNRRALAEDELGELQTVGDAMRWCTTIARGAATGRLSSAAANAATRSVQMWLQANDLHVRMTRLTQLEREVQRLKGMPQ
jgi:hypothetical protein